MLGSASKVNAAGSCGLHVVIRVACGGELRTGRRFKARFVKLRGWIPIEVIVGKERELAFLQFYIGWNVCKHSSHLVMMNE